MRTFLTKVFGDDNEKAIKRLLPTVKDVNELEPAMKALSNE